MRRGFRVNWPSKRYRTALRSWITCSSLSLDDFSGNDECFDSSFFLLTDSLCCSYAWCRRIHWAYFRQQWDLNYDNLRSLDDEREDLLRTVSHNPLRWLIPFLSSFILNQLFWCRRENLGKVIFRQRVMKLQHAPNTFVRPSATLPILLHSIKSVW